MLAGTALEVLLNGCGIDAVGTAVADGGAGGPAPSCTDPRGACVPVPPAGWTLVIIAGESAGSARPVGEKTLAVECPAGTSSPRVLLDAPRAPGTSCACTCGPGPNPCAYGTLATSFRSGFISCNDGNQMLVADGACHPLGFAWSDYNAASASAMPVQNAGCPSGSVLPPTEDDGATVVCSLAETTVPCATGSCLVAPPATRRCAMHDGDVACPAGYATKRTLTPRDALVDTRACASCSCATAATSCADAVLTFATDASCTAGIRTVSIDGSCNAVEGSGTPAFYRYRATPDVAACAPLMPEVPMTGAFTLPPPVTLCCEEK